MREIFLLARAAAKVCGSFHCLIIVEERESRDYELIGGWGDARAGGAQARFGPFVRAFVEWGSA